MAKEDDALPAFEPPHPGDYIRSNILPALNMTITELADHLGVSRASLSELVNGRRDLSLDMAQRLGMAFRNGTRFWVALQMQRDLWFMERNKKPSIKPLDWDTDAA